MNIVTLVYPNSEGSRFDADYFVATHVPMAQRLWKDEIADTRLEIGVSGAPSGEPPFHAVLTIIFRSPEALGRALSSPAMGELAADVPNYSSAMPTVQISRAG